MSDQGQKRKRYTELTKEIEAFDKVIRVLAEQRELLVHKRFKLGQFVVTCAYKRTEACTEVGIYGMDESGSLEADGWVDTNRLVVDAAVASYCCAQCWKENPQLEYFCLGSREVLAIGCESGQAIKEAITEFFKEHTKECNDSRCLQWAQS